MTDSRPTLLVHAPEPRAAERRYVLDVVISRWLGFAYELVTHAEPWWAISLLGDPAAHVVELADVLLAVPDDEWLDARSMPSRPLARLTAQAGTGRRPDGGAGGQWSRPESFEGLPVLYGTTGPSGGGWDRSATGATIHVDVLGSIFFLLTRYEELIVSTRDEHDRFPGSASLGDAEGYLERPLADEYVDLLWAAMGSTWPSLVRQPTAFSLWLTHDVDQPWAVHDRAAPWIARSLGADVLLRRDARLAARRLWVAGVDRLGGQARDPIDRFDLFMDVSERHGLRSTFFFQAGLTPADADFRYRITDPRVFALLRRVHERGHEIGLHASYISHGTPAQLHTESVALRDACAAAGIEQDSWGVRQHFLRVTVPRTWRHLAAEGLAYDTSLGFADRVGFRAGTCRSFPLFDLEESQVLPLIERPLVAMDTTLVQALGLGLDAVAERVATLVGACRREGGEAVLLYHNNTSPGASFERHYGDLVDALLRD